MLSRRCLQLLAAALFSLDVSADQAVLTAGRQPASSGNLLQGGTLHRFSIASAFERILDAAKEHDLDIWRTTPSEVDIYLPHSSPELPAELLSLPHTTTPIQPSRPVSSVSRWDGSSLDNTTFHSTYHPLFEIDAFLQDLHLTYPNSTRLINLGHTAEGREMHGITISTGAYQEGQEGNGGGKKKKGRIPIGNPDQKLGFVIMGAQHAREWVASSAALYLAQSLLADSAEPHSLSVLLQHFDFHIVPIPNPDGYDYTWETDRYWYKNRQVLGPEAKCVGLDMNRNWGYKWKAASVKHASVPKNETLGHNTCSHWYPGSRAFESPEVNNIANWVTTLPNVVAFLDLRSYGQMISTPYSYSCKKVAPDAEDQMEAALGASSAIRSAHGSEYKVGRLCEMLYAAPGNVVDWMYSTHASIKYAYVAHLRDTGTYGFSLPEMWIRPTAEETTNLVSYLARFIATQTKRKF